MRPGRTAKPIFTLYGPNDVFRRKEEPFGVRMGVNRLFQAKTAKYKNHNISESINPMKTKFKDQPQTNNCTSWVV